MRRPKAKPIVFISYAREDAEWRDLFLRHLSVLQQQDQIRLWHDGMIGTGDDWYPEIRNTIRAASVALCLISTDYLASGFVNKEEIPALLEQRRRGTMLLLPVVIKPCPWKTVRWLTQIQMFPDPKTPLSSLCDDVEREQVLSNITEYIFHKIKDPTFTLGDPVPRWRALPSEHVSIERMPNTSTEIFGRADELALLDRAWESEAINIVCFVAWGGAGKSTLVNKWLAHLGEDSYRGAARVFAWSFYCQSTGERATSADLFIDSALQWFGDSAPSDSHSPWEKGQRLASLVQQMRVLLLLDGLEPLQSSWEHNRGEVDDPGVAVLLRELAKKNPGLCVITTREHITCLDAYVNVLRHVDLQQMSDEAGRALLRFDGIRGTDAELEEATRDFGNHALALSLLGAYLQNTPGYHVSAARSIAEPDGSVVEGTHPHRVIAALARELGQSSELDVLHMLGLFDRPASSAEVNWLRTQVEVPGLNEQVRRLSEREWERVLQNLRHLRLIARESRHNVGAIDTHPLVREYFGGQLKQSSENAWRRGHSNLYDFLRLSTVRFPDTMRDMAPLYHAVAHACHAGRHREALHDIYWQRIQRGSSFYPRKKLGAFNADLTTLRRFFSVPWRQLDDMIPEADRANVLNEAGFYLSALGRLVEAIQLFEEAHRRTIAQRDWLNAAKTAENLGEHLLTLGQSTLALERCETCVEYADRSGHLYTRVEARALRGDVLHQMGRLPEAAGAFDDAAALLANETRARYPFIPGLRGYQHRDLQMSCGEHAAARSCAAQTLQWAQSLGLLLDVALDHLALGRAHLQVAQDERSEDLTAATTHLNEAVGGLRKAGMRNHLPRGLLARTELHRMRGDHVLARHDLAEAYEIASRSAMRLFECDCHLECCRLLVAIDETHARLTNDDLDPASPLALYDPTAGSLRAAWRHIQQAQAMIHEMGYHRRDPDVLLATAHLQLLEGNKQAAQRSLDDAKGCIDKIGCHSWRAETSKLAGRIAN